MSLAPASSLGFFLNARLAVKGIQCAARSLGTLTAGAFGLLSSMGASSEVWGRCGSRAGYQLHRATGTPRPALFRLNRADLREYLPSVERCPLFRIMRRDQTRRSRTPRPRNPRYRARAAAIAGRRLPAPAGNGRFRITARLAR